jgi:hypothetical protein
MGCDVVRCVAADPATRVAGAILLWSIEIIMQMRIYILYNSSKRVRAAETLLFLPCEVS